MLTLINAPVFSGLKLFLGFAREIEKMVLGFGVVVLLGILAAWVAAKAAMKSSLVTETPAVVLTTVLSLAMSLVCTVIGAIPFAALDRAGNSEPGGASFALLAWIIMGPPICFILTPLIYAFLTSIEARRSYREFGFPVVGSIALLLLVVLSDFTSKAASLGEDIGITLQVAAMLSLGWWLYVKAMDRWAGV